MYFNVKMERNDIFKHREAAAYLFFNGNLNYLVVCRIHMQGDFQIQMFMITCKKHAYFQKGVTCTQQHEK